jgi:hypothetical protein
VWHRRGACEFEWPVRRASLADFFGEASAASRSMASRDPLAHEVMEGTGDADFDGVALHRVFTTLES